MMMRDNKCVQNSRKTTAMNTVMKFLIVTQISRHSQCNSNIRYPSFTCFWLAVSKMSDDAYVVSAHMYKSIKPITEIKMHVDTQTVPLLPSTPTSLGSPVAFVHPLSSPLIFVLWGEVRHYKLSCQVFSSIKGLVRNLRRVSSAQKMSGGNASILLMLLLLSKFCAKFLSGWTFLKVSTNAVLLFLNATCFATCGSDFEVSLLESTKVESSQVQLTTPYLTVMSTSASEKNREPWRLIRIVIRSVNKYLSVIL